MEKEQTTNSTINSDLNEDSLPHEEEKGRNTESETVEAVFAEDEDVNVESTEAKTEELQELKERIEQLEKELQEKEDRMLRLQAEYDNFRKRTRSEQETFNKYRSQSLATELLASIDNFERALQTEVQSEEAKALQQGMEMVYRSILDAFKKEKIEPIESVGQVFDPRFHHAVMQGNEADVEPNIVLEELQKGYILDDRVIRPAMVKVNQ